MAFESRYWRNKIKKDVNFIYNKLEISTFSFDSDKIDQFYSEIEIKLFNIAYGIRKLIETERIPNRVADEELLIKSFKRNNKQLRPWGFFDDFYNLENSKDKNMRLRLLCNQFIHSRFFQIIPNKQYKIRELFFTSDYSIKKEIYKISIKKFLNFIKKRVDTYPVSISHKFDDKTRLWKSIVK